MTDYLEKNAETRNHFCKVASDILLLAQDDAETADKLLKQAIFDSDEFKVLPNFQRTFVLGFIAGKRDDVTPPIEIGKPIPEREVPPKSVRDLQPGVTWTRHPNGGGWKSETAYVEASAHLGSKAVVYGNARVMERARVYGAARIGGDAELYGACHVHGLAAVTGRAQVFDGARVLGRAVITGDAQVGGVSLVRGTTRLETGLYLDERIAPKISSIQELKPGVVKRGKAG